MEGFLFLTLFLHLGTSTVIILYLKISEAYDAVAQAGQTADVKCVFNDSFGELTDIVWFFNDTRLMKHRSSIGSSHGRYQPVLPLEKSSATFKVKEVTFDDAGVYTCEQYFKTGKSAKHHTTLQVQGFPVIYMEGNSSIVNKPTFATCSVRFALEPEFTSIAWTIDDENISPNSSFAVIENGHHESPAANFYYSNITLNLNRYHNRKLLKCTLIGKVNSSTSVHLNILFFPTICLKSVQYGRRHLFFVAENDSVNISCISEGNPTPRIHLEKRLSYKVWNKIPLKPILFESYGESVSTIFTLTKEDASTFRCVAENDIGRNISSVNVTVELKRPVTVKIITHRSGNIFSRDIFSISCVAQGHPAPQVHLEKISNNKKWVKLQFTPTKTIQNSSINFTFIITNAKHNSSGVYRCSAFNELGSNATSLNMTIKISVWSTLQHMILSNIHIVILLGAVLLLVVISVYVKKIHKRVLNRYNVATAETRNERVGNIAVTGTNFEDTPDLCRSLPPLPTSREAESPLDNTLGDSNYEDMHRLRQDYEAGSDGKGTIDVHEQKCEVKYYVLERP